ncbi:hypothetical protein K439DRAFT_1642183 [Ramaria rubella]|nr:hypothetical protein K439DRAFT_1642183 [Ramaria rubella]
MPNIPVITISCPRGLRTSGDVITGVLDLHLALAEEKEVTAITLTLRGEITTQITVYQGNGESTTLQDKVSLFTQKQVIWEPGWAVPPHSSGIASFPFSFTMPTMYLPPSFHSGTHATGGSVRYYIHGVATRKSWYKQNFRVDRAFPFLPVDTSPAPLPSLHQWAGEWQTFSTSKKMRRGIVSHHGLAVAEISMPKLAAIPLFQPIPIRIRIVCTSKPFPRSASNQADTFEFPRCPKVTDIDLNLRQTCNVVVGNDHRKCTDQLGLQAGFGLPDERHLRDTWGNQVQRSNTSPHWVADETDADRGFWSEEVVFSSAMILRCPPPFSTPSLISSIFLDLDVDFPGLGNKLQTCIGPLSLTSGITSSDNLISSPETQIPFEMDLPPTYYEVMQMDEKSSTKVQ